MLKFAHFNFNVLDLEKSLAFYKEALGLEPVREKVADDGSVMVLMTQDREDDSASELMVFRLTGF